MRKRLRYDLVVVGAGSGGYAAARTARALGASVALADHGPLGGLCILRGCMPSKTLLASSERAQAVREAAEFGVRGVPPEIDLEAMMRRKERIVQGFTDYRVENLATFPLYEGRARFASPHELLVGEDIELEARSFVVATGSVVAPPALPGLRDVGYIDSDEALSTRRLPDSLIVLGGGYVAVELGQFFARLGARTTMLIRAPRLLASEDTDVGEAVTEAFRAEGIRVESEATLLRAERGAKGKTVRFARDGEEHAIEADEIFYALGRVPNIASLDLERAGVASHHVTGVAVGPDLRTNVPHIFAVGDVTGRFPLVHVAIYQGEIAARNAVGGGAEQADYALQKTHAIFCDPQVAVAGETEKSLMERGIAYRAASYPFDDHGKSIAIGKTRGFVKMLAAPEDGRILGAAVVGPDASELIHETIVAMRYRATASEFAAIPHLHPTLAEIWTYPAEELALAIEQKAV